MPWSDLPEPNEPPQSEDGVSWWKVLAIIVFTTIVAICATSWFVPSAVQ